MGRKTQPRQPLTLTVICTMRMTRWADTQSEHEASIPVERQPGQELKYDNEKRLITKTKVMLVTK